MSKETAVILFRQGDQVATIVTDGQAVRSYTTQQCRSHRTLHKAVAHLECKGYRIDI